MKNLILSTLIILAAQISVAQTTVVVRPGQNNLPITEVEFVHNGATVTQTTEASGTLVNTSNAVALTHLKINDGGTIKTLTEFNDQGAIIINNNFTASTSGVGVYNEGGTTSAVNTTAWEEAMIGSGTDNNLLNYLYYDGASNVPSGADFDILWTKGWENFEYLVVGERNGNTCFALQPIDSTGNIISSANTLQFGNCYGSNLAEYDWNIGYAPSNVTNQPFVFTVVKMSEFNTSSTIYGFRIDNTGNADPKFFGLSDQPFSNNATNPMIPGLAGNIFHDIDGLVDNNVDGDGIYNPSSTTLYANLVDANGKVVSTTAISADGSYEFLDLEPATYSVAISTTQGTVGQNAPASTLPSEWLFTGEEVGVGSGSDGNPNGVLSNIVITTAVIFDVNFGIEVAPQADSYNETIQSPTYQSTQSLTAKSGYPQLSGTDTEDGSLGAGNTLVVTDTAGMNGNELYYNGIRVELNSSIENFNPSLLTVKFVGDATTSFSFNYFFKDAADADANTPATYTINWSDPLPVDWLSFEVSYENGAAKIYWTTAQEANNSHFEVLRSDRSKDINEYEVVAIVEGKGFYQGISQYEFNDNTVELGKTYAFKIRQVDFDGESSYTNTLILQLDELLTRDLEVYPNPFTSQVNFKINGSNHDRIVVKDLAGRVVEDVTSYTQTGSINAEEWQSGIYFFTLYKGAGSETLRVIKR